MSNDKNIIARIFNLWAKISMLILDGKRDPHKIVNVLQKILDTPDLLIFIGSSFISAMQFNSYKVFTTGRWYLGNNFRKNFLVDKEEEVPEVTLRQHELTKPSKDGPIREELGHDNEEILLGQFHSFLMQANHDRWYIAYIRDANGKLWTVGAGWCGDGWDVGAFSVGCPSDWDLGGVVVSR